MKKTIFILLMISMLAGTQAFAATAGRWGVFANNVVYTYKNLFDKFNTYEDMNTYTYSGFFYQATKDMSFDFGFSYINREMENTQKQSLNSYYFRALYNLGSGTIIPHVGLELIKTAGRLGHKDIAETNHSIIVGTEIKVMDDLSVMADLKVLEKVLFEGYGFLGDATAINMMPVLSVRWYL